MRVNRGSVIRKALAKVTTPDIPGARPKLSKKQLKMRRRALKLARERRWEAEYRSGYCEDVVRMLADPSHPGNAVNE